MLDSVLRLFLTSLRKHPTHVALASFPSGDRVWLQNSSEAHLAPPSPHPAAPNILGVPPRASWFNLLPNGWPVCGALYRGL